MKMSGYINLKFCVYVYPNMHYSMPRYDFVKIDLNLFSSAYT